MWKQASAQVARVHESPAAPVPELLGDPPSDLIKYWLGCREHFWPADKSVQLSRDIEDPRPVPFRRESPGCTTA